MRLAAAIGESDCEALTAGLFAQPVNTWSSAAYLAAGALIVWLAVSGASRRRLLPVVFGGTVAALGIGSILFHGAQPAGARFLHDLPIAAVLAFVGLHGAALMAGWRDRTTVGIYGAAATLAAVLLAVWPGADTALFGVLGLAAAGAEVRAARAERRTRSPGYLTGLAVLAGGGLLNVLGRTSGPLCDAESALQLHAAWHVATAVALAIWAWVALFERPGPQPARPAGA